MKFGKASHLIVTLLIASAASFVCQAKGWEMNPKTERTETRQVVKDTEIEIRAARGLILVTANHPVQIKIFTILGQQISSETLPAGTSQFSVNAHGVYIVKAGDLTCKVAL